MGQGSGMNIKIAATDNEIAGCFSSIAELRSHLSAHSFVKTVRRMMGANNFELAYLEDNGVKAVAGFRISEWLLTGRYQEVEELVTTAKARSQGHGSLLFHWLATHAGQQGCRQLRLLSGVARADAHRFYERKGVIFEAKYFSMMLE